MGFIPAVVAFGWGLSLGELTGAGRPLLRWPMGARGRWIGRLLPISLGILCISAGVPLFSAGTGHTGATSSARRSIPAFGVASGGVLDRLPLGVGAQRARCCWAPPGALLPLVRWLELTAGLFRLPTLLSCRGVCEPHRGLRAGDFAAFRESPGAILLKKGDKAASLAHKILSPSVAAQRKRRAPAMRSCPSAD